MDKPLIIADMIKLLIEKNYEEINRCDYGQVHINIYHGKIVNFWIQKSIDLGEVK